MAICRQLPLHPSMERKVHNAGGPFLLHLMLATFILSIAFCVPENIFGPQNQPFSKMAALFATGHFCHVPIAKNFLRVSANCVLNLCFYHKMHNSFIYFKWTYLLDYRAGEEKRPSPPSGNDCVRSILHRSVSHKRFAAVSRIRIPETMHLWM